MHVRALVYRESPDITCKDCPEAVAQLLGKSPSNFRVTFVGPNEDMDVDEDTLKGVALLVFHSQLGLAATLLC